MNTALYILNALAVVALVSFQLHSSNDDAALVHLDTEHFVSHPAAQWAVMNSQQGQAAFLASDRESVDSAIDPATTRNTERFTF